MMKTVTIVVGLLLTLSFAAPAAAQPQGATPPAKQQTVAPPASRQLENRKQAQGKFWKYLKDVEQQFQEVSSNMDATVAQRKQLGKPPTARQLADFEKQKRQFKVRFEQAKGRVQNLDQQLKDLEQKQEDLKNTRQEMTTDFEAADQKTNQLMNTLANILKTMREMQANLVKGIR
jgi:predicted  nucleic acid-binding Zn-ribbon protein